MELPAWLREPLDTTEAKVENRWENLPYSPRSAALPRAHVQRPNDTTPDQAPIKGQLKKSRIHKASRADQGLRRLGVRDSSFDRLICKHHPVLNLLEVVDTVWKGSTRTLFVESNNGTLHLAFRLPVQCGEAGYTRTPCP
jgi:hypothetical protein